MRSLAQPLKTAVLLAALTGVLVGLGGLAGRGAATIALVLGLGMNLAAYLWSDRMVLAMHRARPLSPAEAPEVHRIVETLAARAKIPKPAVYLVEDPQPNAFATGRGPSRSAVAVTTGILQILDRRELTGVLAHEIGHIVHRDVLVATVAAGIAGAVSYLAQMLQFAAFFGGRDDEDAPSPLGALAVAIVAPLAATLIQLAISRRREFGADELGARLCGDPLALADALAKLESAAHRIPSHTAEPATASLFIVNPLRAESLARLFSTHPDTRARIERLRALAAEMDRAPRPGPLRPGRLPL